MAKLTAKKRDNLDLDEFGLPVQKKYPMPDKAHAANAKARATQQVRQGNLSPAQAKQIDSKANLILGKKPGK